MILRIITWIFVIAIIYRVLVRFVLPVLHVTKVTNDRMRQMQQQMEDMNKKQAPSKPSPQVEGDYIDYEEVK